MATKNNPGQFDCHGKADPDEPIFTLRAKDPTAAWLVEIWRGLRAGNVDHAREHLNAAVLIMSMRPDKIVPLDSPKSQEAQACGVSMIEWREKNKP